MSRDGSGVLVSRSEREKGSQGLVVGGGLLDPSPS